MARKLDPKDAEYVQNALKQAHVGGGVYDEETLFAAARNGHEHHYLKEQARKSGWLRHYDRETTYAKGKKVVTRRLTGEPVKPGTPKYVGGKYPPVRIESRRSL